MNHFVPISVNGDQQEVRPGAGSRPATHIYTSAEAALPLISQGELHYYSWPVYERKKAAWCVHGQHNVICKNIKAAGQVFLHQMFSLVSGGAVRAAVGRSLPPERL